MDARLIAKVADELARLQAEKAHAELVAHRTFVIQLAKEFRREERVSRRRVVRNFTYKQLLVAERIMRELEETKRPT